MAEVKQLVLAQPGIKMLFRLDSRDTLSREAFSPIILLLARYTRARGSNDYRVVSGAIVGAPPRDDTIPLLAGVGLVDTARRPLLFVCIYSESSRGAAGLHRHQ